MVVIGRISATHDCAGTGEVDSQLVRDGGFLHVGNEILSEQCRQNVAVLTSLARCKRSQRTDWKAKVETDSEKVTGTDTGSRQNEQAMFRKESPDLVHDGKDRIPATIHDGAAADLHNMQPGEKLDRTHTRDRVRDRPVEECLTSKCRGDMFDVTRCLCHTRILSLQ
jgi:hypothetical protein